MCWVLSQRPGEKVRETVRGRKSSQPLTLHLKYCLICTTIHYKVDQGIRDALTLEWDHCIDMF